MRTLTIREPIWKNRSIGIASYRANSDLRINISYRDKKGKRLFPDTYFIKKDQIIKYPIQKYKGIKLYIIPIEDLQIDE